VNSKQGLPCLNPFLTSYVMHELMHYDQLGGIDCEDRERPENSGRGQAKVFSCVGFSTRGTEEGRSGSLERLDQAADRMLTDPNAVKRGYVPDTTDVIASLGLLFP
jgi:hypothetical protein